MVIPENKIEEVRSAVSIVDIISEYVQLKRRGKNYLGICPFHQEKTPSFIVSPDKQIYHCFGCSAGGNVFRFLMDYENISFPEAVLMVAKKAGITIETENLQPGAGDNENEAYYDINTSAARHFSQNLLESDSGKAAREYFSKRHIKSQMWQAFGLGFALQGWDGFVNYAKSGNIDFEKARELGLVEKKEKGGYYDKFRDRIIFPIFSPNGRVIAFGGRIMDSTLKAAKYLNSPESPVYFKRKTLYGLFHSKDEIRRLDKAILVEGYMDLISLYQAGIKNVVASCGTALTDEQAQLLSRYTRNIVVFYDSDNAGIKASLRSIEILLKQSFDVRIAELPSGEDPDSYVNKNGRESIEEAVNRALNFLEYQSVQFEKKGMFNDPVLLTKAIRGLVESASFVNDELKRTVLLKTIAKKYGLRENLVERELQAFLTGKTGAVRQNSSLKLKENTKLRQPEQVVEQTSIKKKGAPVAEKEIILLLFQGDRSVVEFIFNNLTPEDFTVPAFQHLSEIVYDSFLNGGDVVPGSLLDKIKDEKIKQYIIKNAVEKYSVSKAWEEYHPGVSEAISLQKYAKDAVKSLRLYRIEKEIQYNSKLLGQSGDEGEVMELMKKNNSLIAERKIVLAGL